MVTQATRATIRSGKLKKSGVRWLERRGAGTSDLLQDLLQFVVENLGSGVCNKRWASRCRFSISRSPRLDRRNTREEWRSGHPDKEAPGHLQSTVLNVEDLNFPLPPGMDVGELRRALTDPARHLRNRA